MKQSTIDFAPLPGHVLCQIDEIDNNTGKAFTFGSGKQRFDMFIVRCNDVVFGYVNICPHARTPLDWTPNQFFNREKTHLLCATHGALFQIHDGWCVSGPCKGRFLTPIPVIVQDNQVMISDHESV